MKCMCCGIKIETLASTTTPYGGVATITRPLRVCNDCPPTEKYIYKNGQLNQVILDYLVLKPAKLNSDEIRFIVAHSNLSHSTISVMNGISAESLEETEIVLSDGHEYFFRCMVFSIMHKNQSLNGWLINNAIQKKSLDWELHLELSRDNWQYKSKKS